MANEEAKFSVNDLVTSEGNGEGRITATRFAVPATLKAEGKARIAGTDGAGAKPEWFYKVAGKNFNKDLWYRQASLKLVSDV